MEPLLQNVVGRFTDYISDQVKESLSPVGPYLRMLSIGLVLMIVASVFWAIGGLFLLAAVFFSLSPLAVFVSAALWTTLISWVAGAIITLFGLMFLRRPR